jgi:DNA-binding NarL/FixJ family response regulator
MKPSAPQGAPFRVIDNLLLQPDHLRIDRKLGSPWAPRPWILTGKVGAGVPPIRVLVIEDFEPFRRLICSTLEGRGDLEVICEVFDGLAAVQKAEELQPDLILLDIGLPTLNGMEAARQIRKLVPEAKILFVSQESSPDVVQEALSLGARGYVVKTRAGSDLLSAVDAVLLEKQFVSPLGELESYPHA